MVLRRQDGGHSHPEQPGRLSAEGLDDRAGRPARKLHRRSRHGEAVHGRLLYRQLRGRRHRARPQPTDHGRAARSAARPWPRCSPSCCSAAATSLQLLPNRPPPRRSPGTPTPMAESSLERVRPGEGKDAWLFNRHTVSNLPRMYAAAQRALPRSPATSASAWPFPAAGRRSRRPCRQRPANVPDRLGSPRALLQLLPRMDMADARRPGSARPSTAWTISVAKLPQTPTAGPRRQSGRQARRRPAGRQRRYLRRARFLGRGAAIARPRPACLKIDLVREKDGCWRVSRHHDRPAAGAFFDKLNAKEQRRPRTHPASTTAPAIPSSPS